MIIDINPIALSIGQFSIRWYGLAYLVSILAGWLYIKHGSQKILNDKQVDDLVYWIILGILVGGRLGYCLIYNLNYCLKDPLEFLRVWNGGMSFHGGLIGVILSCWYFSIKHSKPLLAITDIIVPCLPLGLFLGRLGNFINGELVGRACDASWCVIFAAYDYVPRYPSQLFEAFGEGIILGLFILLIKRRNHIQGQLSAAFLILYAVIRIFAEQFREPDPQIGFLFMHITMGQLLSISMIFAGLILYARTVYPKMNTYGI